MAGASLPYHLRPHKAVDRRIFLDLLRRFERWRPLSDYAYLSMGAYPLEDHKLIHRALGITRLIAFDFDEKIVARQKFNRPIDRCQCLHKTSGDVIAGLDATLDASGFQDASGVIVWLDYTDPKELGVQLREFQGLLDRLGTGDIVRVTVNAHLQEPGGDSDSPMLVEKRQRKQFEKIRERIGDLLPSTAGPADMTAERLPMVLSAAFAAAVLKALPIGGANTFKPLSITRYRDGQQMLSITGTIVARNDVTAMLSCLNLEAWPFASTDWSRIYNLVVPDLTIRERLYLEREVMSKNVTEIVASLGFEEAGDIRMDEFLENYKNYYRFYPTLIAAEL